MLRLSEIVARLQDKRLSYISKETGLNHNHLIRIRDGSVHDPRISTLEKLSDYFENYDKQCKGD